MVGEVWFLGFWVVFMLSLLWPVKPLMKCNFCLSHFFCYSGAGSKGCSVSLKTQRCSRSCDWTDLILDWTCFAICLAFFFERICQMPCSRSQLCGVCLTEKSGCSWACLLYLWGIWNPLVLAFFSAGIVLSTFDHDVSIPFREDCLMESHF